MERERKRGRARLTLLETGREWEMGRETKGVREREGLLDVCECLCILILPGRSEKGERVSEGEREREGERRERGRDDALF